MTGISVQSGRYTPLLALVCSTLASVGVSIYSLQAGYTIIFQNLYYIPIILACILYLRKGLLFSCVLAFLYFGLMAVFRHDPDILLQAGIRVILFIGIAGVITSLATSLRRTEDSLRQENEFHESIITNALVWFTVLDRDGTILLWNSAAEEISGYYSGDVLGRNDVWKQLYPDPEYRKQVTDVILQMAASIHSYRNYETTIRTRTGDNRVISWNMRTIHEDGGSLTRYVVIGVDVTDRNTATEALKNQTRFLNTLMDSLPVPVFYKNQDGIYTGCNPAFEQFVGRSKGEIIGKTVYDLWPESLAAIYNKADRALFEDPVDQKYETQVMYADGSAHDVVFSKAPLFDDKDRLTGLIGAFLDITERKMGEAALRESEQKYRSLFENMLEGFAYCRMIYDEQARPVDWIYLDVNAAFESITGLQNITGKRVSVAIPGIREQTPDLFEHYDQVVKTGIPKSFEYEFTPLAMWLHISVYRPEPDHFVAVFEDITGRKRAEKNLQKIIRDHQTILDNVPVMIWFKDTQNRIVKINPAAARIFGKPVQDIEGKTLPELFSRLDDTYYPQDKEVMQSKTPQIGIVERHTIPGGEQIWLQTDTLPLFDDNGESIGVLVVSNDITESKRAKDAITLANHKLNLLSGITRHDIGNELQVIFGYLDLVLDEKLDPEVKEFISKANDSAHYIERQISFTRDYQDIGVHSPIWQDVGGIISRIREQIDEPHIQITVLITDVEIYADPLLEKVFYNLIDNSRRYGEKITEIRFYGSEDPDGYTLVCEDDGVGIPEEFKEKIFRREYFKHTGFGLNLSREILDITGLSIRETGILGTGARFEIHIPTGSWRYGTSGLKDNL